ncbi:Lrp/AsnC family transcriptional regulator [Sphingomonas cannabina]|uniref:Lrp/AsnC family transcriptional regulator n=1 Tax=Sphingomonas cannabina TaxID=2899123 RepID=UPI001F2FD575|nr:Lrp/AsnC family transcriptional regulator [Sphingomonas cannabina]UIJ46735.1 Lrp/AsnC family transcriptional regulator [Sphingomonas cannabina]
MQPLDQLDRRIIAALRGDARAPIAKIAGALQVSRATVQARLDRLLASGMILGFTVRVQETGDEGLRAIMMIEVAGRSTSAIIRRLRSFPELRALHTTNGAWDLVAEIHAEDLRSFDRILREIRSIDGILNSETSILLSSA